MFYRAVNSSRWERNHSISINYEYYYDIIIWHLFVKAKDNSEIVKNGKLELDRDPIILEESKIRIKMDMRRLAPLPREECKIVKKLDRDRGIISWDRVSEIRQ